MIVSINVLHATALNQSCDKDLWPVFPFHDENRILITNFCTLSLQITILKINGFVVLFVEESKDYIGLNHDQISNQLARLAVETSLFIGGLGPQVQEGSHPLNRAVS